jgi:RHS repeat-associated protein
LQLREHGFSRALASWNEAWTLAKDSADVYGRAVADGAIAEWLTLSASFGQIDEVQERLSQIADRGIAGSAGSKIAAARETIALIKGHPERTLPCGPEALLALLAERGIAAPSFLSGYRPTSAGTSLKELEILATRSGISLRTAFREDASQLPIPAIVHLKINHFVTVTERQGDRYRVVDRTRAAIYWVTSDTLFDESTGYVLIAADAKHDGWRDVTDAEGSQVTGRGPACPDGSQNTNPPCGICCKPGPGCGSGTCKGMAVYEFDATTTSLRLLDRPVGYTPPRGPAVPMTIAYLQRDALQPQIFTSTNLGPKWSFEWVRFVQEEPTDAQGITPAHVWVALPPGGREVFSQPDAQGTFPAHWNSRATLVRVNDSPVRYERRLADGSVEVYTVSDGAPVGQRRVLMSALTDPLGQTLSLTWDSQARLVAITDALGQVTTIAYEHADSLKITRITDPFGRFATFTYNAAGQLASITDVVGITSSFSYGPNDFVGTLRTPYGVTTFRHEPNSIDTSFRFIEATDALGGTEHLEFQWETASLATTASSSEVPTGFAAWNTNLNHYNSFYWNKLAWMLGKNDLSKAEITHWLVKPEWSGWQKYSYVPHSIKKPLESRVWYAYPGQSSGNEDELGWWRMPSRIGRVLDDGTSQIWVTEYNAMGYVTQTTDPVGRSSIFSYASNGIDQTEIRQANGASTDLIATYTSNALHLPLTITDVSGQTVSYTYDTQGRTLTTTTPVRSGITENRTTTYTYDSNGYLLSLSGPSTGTATTYTYDAYGRIRTITDPDNYTVTLDYDALDRVIRVSYPDGTYEETIYDKLDPSRERDRLGRWTQTFYDSLRRAVAVVDSMGQVTTLVWCSCGSLDKIVDPNGNATAWERDGEGRVVRTVNADGSDSVLTFENTTSRPKQFRDPKQQVTTIQYFLDNTWKQVSYTNTTNATPSVSFTYDPIYPRLASMTDGSGTTTYAFNAISQTPALGAGQLSSVDGPLSNDAISYTYDELGRVTERSINGVSLSTTYDALHRVSAETNALGSFAFSYDGATDRLSNITYPNGQTTTLAYFGANQDYEIQDIHNRLSGGATLSRFQYTYDKRGILTSWSQQADGNPAKVYEFGRDLIGRLTTATLRTGDPIPVILKRYAYLFDRASNRTGEEIGDETYRATTDTRNAATSIQSGGSLTFAGTVSEPATVTVQGRTAVVTAANEFIGSASVQAGTTTVAVTATDASGNTRTNGYEVTQPTATQTLTYDANGSLTADGTRTFEWDGANRLVAINEGTHRTEFTYDGLSHRTRIVEKDATVVITDRSYIWCGESICEERLSDGSVVRRFFDHGMQENGVAFFYTMDHLGSIRELTDTTGSVRARYDYDPYGRMTKVSGDKDSFYTFAGLWSHAPSGLMLSPTRAYDPAFGRWVSEDPIGLRGGLNVHGYAEGMPTDFSDPSGLFIPGSVGMRILVWAARAGLGAGAGGVAAAGAAILASAAAGYMIGTWIDQHYINPPADPQTQTAPSASRGKTGKGGAGRGPKSSLTPAERKRSDDERRAYKKKCDDANVEKQCPDPCERQLMTIQRIRACIRMRTEWDDNWDWGRHTDHIRGLIDAVNKMEDWYRKNCQ